MSSSELITEDRVETLHKAPPPPKAATVTKEPKPVKDIVLDVNPERELALKLVRAGKNVFLTGSGGSGKSAFINEIMNVNTILCAYTGIAAQNVGGVTCTKAFKLPVQGMCSRQEMNTIPNDFRKLFKLSSNITRIIIDEISFLRIDYMELLDKRLKQLRKNDNPFGGMQMVVVGDFFQLPSIVGRDISKEFYKRYPSSFCFDYEGWSFNTIVLKKNYRNSDPQQQALLNSIRVNDKWASKAIQRINEWAKPYRRGADCVHICNYKADADRHNKTAFAKIPGKQMTYTGVIEGNAKDWEKTTVPILVHLKVGCKVLIKANCKEGTYSNGSRGEVLEMQHDYVLVKLDTGEVVTIEPYEYEKYDYKMVGGINTKVVVSSFTQLPILLGYAITVHSCQGLTMSSAALDTGRGCFSHAQLYVALSRVTDLKNLMLVKPIFERDLITDPAVIDFYNSIEEHV